MDLVIRSRRLPQRGETVSGGDFFRASGGKGANQAVAAARAAAEPVLIVAAVGDDMFGRELQAQLAQENLICRFKIVTGQPSGVAIIMVDERGQNVISVASGANQHLLPADVDAIPAEVFTSGRVLLTTMESPVETVALGLERAKQAGLLTILNPAPAMREVFDQRLLQWVDVLTPNEGEASVLTGYDAVSDAGVVFAARECIRLGCKSLVVTRGSRGCLVVDDQISHVNGCNVQAIDTTAAGDAFNGALAVALAEGCSLVDAARWANAAAAISVTRLGAQPSLATRKEIEQFITTVAAN